MTTAPMTRLIQKNVRFEWSEKCQASFEKLKAFLTEALVLTIKPKKNSIFLKNGKTVIIVIVQVENLEFL